MHPSGHEDAQETFSYAVWSLVNVDQQLTTKPLDLEKKSPAAHKVQALCSPLFVLVSSVPASILQMHDIRLSGFRLLTSGVDMIRVSNYGSSSLSYRSIAVKPCVIADQHSACHNTAVRLKEVLRCLWNLNAQEKCNALLATTSKPCQMLRYQLYHC